MHTIASAYRGIGFVHTSVAEVYIWCGIYLTDFVHMGLCTQVLNTEVYGVVSVYQTSYMGVCTQVLNTEVYGVVSVYQTSYMGVCTHVMQTLRYMHCVFVHKCLQRYISL